MYVYNYNVNVGEVHETVQSHPNITRKERIIDTYGPTKKHFHWPFLLAKGSHDELIVGNNSEDTKHIVMFDKNLQYLRDIGAKGFGNGTFLRICGITVNKVGFLYATDGELHCVQKFTLHDGKFISQFGKWGSEHGEFCEPSGLLCSESNLLYVCDRRNSRIQVFQDDKFRFAFGKFGGRNQHGCFNQPVDLTLNSSEQQLFITDWDNDRIQVFTPKGMFIRQINNAPDVLFHLYNPNGIFCTQNGYLLVSSKFHILIFKEDGTFVSSIEGISSNTVNFKDPIGVIMMNNGKVVVSDGLHGTNRLIVFS